MKKFLMLLMSLTLLLALAACNQQPQDDPETDVPVEEEQVESVDDALIDVPAEDTEAPAEEESEPEVSEQKKPEAKPEQKPTASAPAAKPEQKPAETPAVKPEAAPEQSQPETAQSPAKTLLADFKTRVNGGTTDPEALASALVGNKIIPFMGASMPVEPGFLNGFSNEISGFAKGAMFGPSIGTIPFIGHIFEVDANTDVNAFITTLKNNADLRWNICTSADEMVVDSVGKTVFFVMAPAQFEE